MGLFSKFKKSEKSSSRSAELSIAAIDKIGSKGAQISFNIPSELEKSFSFKAGQYLNLSLEINGETVKRSYSICSGKNENLAIGVKAVENGLASNFLVNSLKTGQTIEVGFPEGNFSLKDENSIVAFAAGSGITPLLSIAKSVEGTAKKMILFYVNSNPEETFFKTELTQLKNTETHFFYSREKVDGAGEGRFDKAKISEIIKSNLSLLRSDGFYLCGPEEMILNTQEVLTAFGVNKQQIHYELFTAPVLLKSESTESEPSDFKGVSKISAILDGEVTKIELAHNGKSILDALDYVGMDVPYSCKGGVCCTCKAKIVEGSAKMTFNYALTDEEVKNGYILTCQSHPTSEVLKLDFDA